MKGTRITCEDLESGETETQTIVDGYCIVTDGLMEVTSMQVYGNGTVQLTLKKKEVPA